MQTEFSMASYGNHNIHHIEHATVQIDETIDSYHRSMINSWNTFMDLKQQYMLTVLETITYGRS